MKFFFIPIFCILTSSISAIADQHLDSFQDGFCYASPSAQVIDGRYYLFNQSTPYTGENLCVYVKNGQLASKGEIKEGKRLGLWSHWLEGSSEIWRKEQYEDGSLVQETHFTYFDNGQQKSSVSYKDGQLDGEMTFWNENGGIWKKEQYVDGSLVHESHYIFYDSGKVKKERNYKNGKLNGRFMVWHDNGKKKSMVDYKDDKENGKFISWYRSGQIKQEAYYQNGQLNGEMTSWNENGQIESVEIFKEGVCVSESCDN